jgi:hypothetical protein
MDLEEGNSVGEFSIPLDFADLTESDFAANYTIFYSLQSKGMIFDFWSLF